MVICVGMRTVATNSHDESVYRPFHKLNWIEIQMTGIAIRNPHGML